MKPNLDGNTEAPAPASNESTGKESDTEIGALPLDDIDWGSLIGAVAADGSNEGKMVSFIVLIMPFNYIANFLAFYCLHKTVIVKVNEALNTGLVSYNVI